MANIKGSLDIDRDDGSGLVPRNFITLIER